MRIISINTSRLEATIFNEIAPQLKSLVDASKAGTPTDPLVRAFAQAVAVGVRKAMVQALDESKRGL